jgi:branched-chain amino acid transport system ATP-binding protein
VCAVAGVSLKVNEGEIVSVIGANGAGKTTVLSTICGLLHPRSGRIKFLGEYIDQKSPHNIARGGIAMVPQGRRLFGDQNTMDNLRLGAYTRPKDADYRRNLEAVLSLFPVLKEREHQLASTLSGGEQQMLAIGRAMMAHPKLMLLDEPSMGLAPMVVDAVFDLIPKLNAMGTTILLVEQMAWKSFDVSSRAYVLNLGCVVMGGDVETLRSDAAIRAAYLPNIGCK